MFVFRLELLADVARAIFLGNIFIIYYFEDNLASFVVLKIWTKSIKIIKYHILKFNRSHYVTTLSKP